MNLAGAAALAVPVRRSDWSCPACGGTATTFERLPHTQFHTCPRFGGLSVPYVPAGTPAVLTLREPDDYIGAEDVQRVPETGRPVMSVYIERDHGLDCAAYAHCARVVAD